MINPLKGNSYRTFAQLFIQTFAEHQVLAKLCMVIKDTQLSSTQPTPFAADIKDCRKQHETGLQNHLPWWFLVPSWRQEGQLSPKLACSPCCRWPAESDTPCTGVGKGTASNPASALWVIWIHAEVWEPSTQPNSMLPFLGPRPLKESAENSLACHIGWCELWSSSLRHDCVQAFILQLSKGNTKS